MSSIWQGEKIRLRATEPGDFGLYVDSEGNINTDTEKAYDKVEMPYTPEQRKEILGKAISGSSGDNFLFTAVDNSGEAVGQLVTFDCDLRMGSFKYGLFFTEKARGKGYASEAARILLDYYFNYLRYHKANVYIYDFNTASQKFHEKLGFVKEGILREVAYMDGEYHDAVYYGITSEEFNCIK